MLSASISDNQDRLVLHNHAPDAGNQLFWRVFLGDMDLNPNGQRSSSPNP